MDKQISRWARLGYRRVLLFNAWWPLERRNYRVDVKAKEVLAC